MPLGDQLVGQLSNSTSLPATPLELDRLEVLLIDYLACVVGARRNTPAGNSFLSHDGIIGLGAHLALQSSYQDRDDIDWTVGTHPGSVIWSTIFAMAIHRPKTRVNFVASAMSGYRTSASIANFLGATHRSKWHVTATAGAFGAASAASTALGFSPQVHQSSLHLAGANMGGSGQAPRERTRAAGFNRAAAVSLGLTATLAAHDGARAIEEIWNGPRGLRELFSVSDGSGGEHAILSGVLTSGIRPFPTNGFAQSAVLATAKLSARTLSQVHSIEVEIAEGVASLLDGSRGGPWWDLRSAVAAAWISKNPSILATTTQMEPLVIVTPSNVPVGGAVITVHTSEGKDEITLLSPPGSQFDVPEERTWQEAKWISLAGSDTEKLKMTAHQLIHGIEDLNCWDFLAFLIDA